MTTRKEKLDAIIAKIPVKANCNPYIIAGWILKHFGYDQFMERWERIDITKLRIGSNQKDMFRYLNYHLRKLGWEDKAKYEKEKVEADMEAMSQIMQKFTGTPKKDITPEWLTQMRINYRKLEIQYNSAEDYTERKKIKLQMQRLIRKADALKRVHI